MDKEKNKSPKKERKREGVSHIKTSPVNMTEMRRYLVIDECLRKPGGSTLKEIMEACNEATYYYTGDEKYKPPRYYKDENGLSETTRVKGKNPGYSVRAIQNDIEFMESDQGWNIEVKKDYELTTKKYKQPRFIYRNPSFSITNCELKKDRAEGKLLNDFQFLLRYFENKTNVEALTTLSEVIDDVMFNNDWKAVIRESDFNENLAGFRNYFSRIYSAIMGKEVLKVDYKPYGKEKLSWVLSPYFLKEYNNRWFLFAYNHEKKKLTNAAIDRIVALEAIKENFINRSECEELRDLESYEDYFSSIIGVSHEGSSPVEVNLKFSEKRFPHVRSKKLHPSQKITDEKKRIVSLRLIPNRELYQTLLSFGNEVEVISPKEVRDKMKETIDGMKEIYKK